MEDSYLEKQRDRIASESPLAKERRYISDPSEAPEDVEVQQGEQGGYYYETSGGSESSSEGEEGGGAGDMGAPQEVASDPDAAVEWMSEQFGDAGQEYAEEAAHQYGGHWGEFYDNPQDLLDDFETYLEASGRDPDEVMGQGNDNVNSEEGDSQNGANDSPDDEGDSEMGDEGNDSSSDSGEGYETDPGFYEDMEPAGYPVGRLDQLKENVDEGDTIHMGTSMGSTKVGTVDDIDEDGVWVDFGGRSRSKITSSHIDNGNVHIPDAENEFYDYI